MTIESPWFLLGLVLIPLVWWQYWRVGRLGPYSVSSLKSFGPDGRDFTVIFSYFGVTLRTLSLIFLVAALSRPQVVTRLGKRAAEGLDIVLAIDTSLSMKALDFEVKGERMDRLKVVKTVLEEFIAKRESDRIGMVIFASEAYTQAPLTLDHDALVSFLRRTFIGMAGRATAIGDAIATATKRVKDIDAKSRIVILLTDGSNTAGVLDPRLAADAAASVGVKIYTIGVGSKGQAPMPVQGFFGQQIQMVDVDIDEDLLKEVATKTGGQYFRAFDTDSLIKIYETIDQLETRKIEEASPEKREEYFFVFLWACLISIALELVWGLSPYRRIPS